mmetsp:Transcript_15683/g.39539  ORF Transcript_15683/g.39539 Transcript_15683/m.39539 type:complete len:214 (+) Transcript_15683:947-1588(+)
MRWAVQQANRDIVRRLLRPKRVRRGRGRVARIQILNLNADAKILAQSNDLKLLALLPHRLHFLGAKVLNSDKVEGKEWNKSVCIALEEACRDEASKPHKIVGLAFVREHLFQVGQGHLLQVLEHVLSELHKRLDRHALVSCNEEVLERAFHHLECTLPLGSVGQEHFKVPEHECPKEAVAVATDATQSAVLANHAGDLATEPLISLQLFLEAA